MARYIAEGGIVTQESFIHPLWLPCEYLKLRTGCIEAL